MAELTRLIQTLIHVKEVLHWIIAEDSTKCSQNIINLLNRYPEISYTLIAAPTPPMFKVRNTNCAGLPASHVKQHVFEKYFINICSLKYSASFCSY